MKTIVALVDLSDLAFKILKLAHQLAAALKAQVVILHVVPLEPVVIDMGVMAPTVMQEPEEERVQMQYEQLLEMRDSMIKFGVDAVVQQLEGANLDAVLAEIKTLHADMVMLGSHHHSAFYRLFASSVSDDVLKHAECPVLVVPADEVPQKINTGAFINAPAGPL